MPSTMASSGGRPSRTEASVTAGGFANLIATSKARNSTGIAVITRPGQRRVLVVAGEVAIVSSVVSMACLLCRDDARPPRGSTRTPKFLVNAGARCAFSALQQAQLADLVVAIDRRQRVSV